METIKQVEIEAVRSKKKVTGKDGKENDFLPYTYLMSESVDMWTKSHDGGRSFGAMTTNISECFNGVLKGARGLPIITMLSSLGPNLLNISTTGTKKLLMKNWRVRNGVHMPSPRGRKIGVNMRNTISGHLAINI